MQKLSPTGFIDDIDENQSTQNTQPSVWGKEDTLIDDLGDHRDDFTKWLECALRSHATVIELCNKLIKTNSRKDEARAEIEGYISGRAIINNFCGMVSMDNSALVNETQLETRSHTSRSMSTANYGKQPSVNGTALLSVTSTGNSRVFQYPASTNPNYHNSPIAYSGGHESRFDLRHASTHGHNSTLPHNSTASSAMHPSSSATLPHTIRTVNVSKLCYF